jgi:hypothetical protein
MSEVRRYAVGDLFATCQFGAIVVRAEDYDRLLAQLNQRDEELNSLEHRRQAEQQACRAAERRVKELESERAALREALLIYSGQHERSGQVGHIEMLDIAHAALSGHSRKPELSESPIVAWALTFNGEFNSGWISAGASKASAEGMRDNYISVCRPCNLPKLAIVPLRAALNPTAEAASHDE